MKSTRILLIVFLFLMSCQSKYEKMQGHWHAVITEEQPYFHRVDVIDTMVFKNAHSIAKTQSNDFLFYSEEYPEPQFYDIYSGYGTEKHYLENDTLYVGDHKDKYVKHDLSICRESHFYEDLMVEINLKECGPSSISLEAVEKINSLSFISIGKQNHKNLPQSLSDKIHKDSTLVQVNDVLIHCAEIPKFLFEEKDKLYSTEKLGVCLLMDQAASMEIIDSTFSYLNPDSANLDLYKACFNSKIREVEYVQIKERNDLY